MNIFSGNGPHFWARCAGRGVEQRPHRVVGLVNSESNINSIIARAADNSGWASKRHQGNSKCRSIACDWQLPNKANTDSQRRIHMTITDDDVDDHIIRSEN
jgi:hypothetical protein